MINKLSISNSGYIRCESALYTANDILDDSKVYELHKGINVIEGDIDSGVWGISYLLSMFKYKVKPKLLLKPTVAQADGKTVSLKKLNEKSCYIDEKLYPLFKSKKSVLSLIKSGVKKSKHKATANDIIDTFKLDMLRIQKPVSLNEDERFKAMAAIGYAYGKEIFCFPWLSRKAYDYYSSKLDELSDIFKKLNCIIIIPVGR